MATPRTNCLRIASPLACLLLIQGYCGKGDEHVAIEPSAARFILSDQVCLVAQSPPPPGYHECTPAPFASPAICRDEVRPYFEDSIEAASAAGLVFAEDCFERLEDLGGLPKAASGTWLDCENDCQFFHGDLPEGSPCESHGHRMSDCAQGLVCAPDRTCHQPCDYSFTALEGDFCGPARGMWFVTCDAGLACGPEGTCEPAAGLGAACDATTPCAVGGWCDPDSSSCVPRLSADSPCDQHEQCAADLCIEGVCVESEWLECGRWGW